jgi:hypothetical protein
MDLATAVVTRLAAASAVTDIVTAARIFWGVRPQGSDLPALVALQVSGVPEITLEGEDPDLITSRVQLEAYARSALEGRALVNAASAALLPGTTVGTGEDTMEFELGERTGPRDLGEPDEKGFIHRPTSDVILRHSAGA